MGLLSIITEISHSVGLYLQPIDFMTLLHTLHCTGCSALEVFSSCIWIGIEFNVRLLILVSEPSSGHPDAWLLIVQSNFFSAFTFIVANRVVAKLALRSFQQFTEFYYGKLSLEPTTRGRIVIYVPICNIAISIRNRDINNFNISVKTENILCVL